ncbi:MAG: hypothetical protein EP322_01645 [Bacteroidetes bacterium]|nr:MAG: hypothetical protein EP322_01645 [Bacteroidota bacterium]
MMEKISIFNYEAYYLDYLEGRLNEDDTRELLAFLKAYPECQIEMEDIEDLSFAEGMENVRFTGKSQLKMTEEDDLITPDNVEHFMIADHEGLLDQDKRDELKISLAKLGLEDRYMGYGQTYFSPDTSIKYANKEGLKHKTVVLTWYWYAAAAVIAFVLFTLLPGNSPIEDKTQVFAEDQVVPKNDERDSTIIQSDPSILQEKYYAAQNEAPQRDRIRTKPLDGGRRSDRATENVSLRTHRPGMLSGNTVKDIEPLSPNLAVNNAPDQELMAKNTLTLYNPIEPITNAINNKTNIPVEFKKSTADSERKGFRLKIGKVEISRNSGKR